MADPRHSDTEYYLRRAKEEAHRALTSARPEVAAAHRGLSIGYSAKALLARVNAPDAPAMPMPISAQR